MSDQASFFDPADLPSEEATPRRAQLTVDQSKRSPGNWLVHFDASNGETLGIGETHPTEKLGYESRKAWIRAMIEVLEGDGYTVTPPEEEAT